MHPLSRTARGEAVILRLNVPQTETGETLDPVEIRFRSIAAILARGIGRLRNTAELLGECLADSDNHADSLPDRLELSPKPSLSVSHDVAD